MMKKKTKSIKSSKKIAKNNLSKEESFQQEASRPDWMLGYWPTCGVRPTKGTKT